MLIQISSGMGPRECELAVGKMVKALCEEFPGTEKIHLNGATNGCYMSALLSVPVNEFPDTGTVQWICQSPYRPNHRRKNWFINVSVVPDVAEVEASGEIKFERMHAGGPGGQNVNKVETGVRLTHVPTGITVKCVSERSQHQNKRIALARLYRQLDSMQQTAKAEQKDGAWRDHYSLERGNPVRVYEGREFKRKR